jgi:hypothetical protein
VNGDILLNAFFCHSRNFVLVHGDPTYNSANISSLEASNFVLDINLFDIQKTDYNLIWFVSPH